jgi:hypothetical protein
MAEYIVSVCFSINLQPRAGEMYNRSISTTACRKKPYDTNMHVEYSELLILQLQAMY